MIHRHRGNRRYMTYRKAKRKARIVHELGDYWYYPHFGQYRKGKIHCSCPLCSAKTNTKISKSNGPVRQDRRSALDSGSRVPCTNGRFGKKNYAHSDKKAILRMNDSVLEYLAAT